MSKEPTFEIVHEEVKYKRYLCVSDRHVKFPNGKVIKWDVVGHSFNEAAYYVCVFPYDSKTKTATLIREYSQGTNTMSYGLPCGHYDRNHHRDFAHAAESELSEEAQLRADKLINLLPENHPGIMEVKWCKNRFYPFLALDVVQDADPKPKDEEEYIEILHNVPIARVRELIYGGDMLLHSVQTCVMALNYLEKNNLL